MAGWINEGKIKRKYHVEKGLEGCPKYLQLLYNGGNTGKLCVFMFLLFTCATLMLTYSHTGSSTFHSRPSKPSCNEAYAHSSRPDTCTSIYIQNDSTYHDQYSAEFEYLLRRR